ncbi:MAG TPA: translocation/assembly module TamB domain-containing protein [Candidatus Kapabacteria bacterium]|nr:translocation/assembly module TamB domain-containing protein [Candidatus Kapabacteria bacterium]
MTRTINSIVRVSARLLVALFTGIAFLCALVIALTQVGPVRTWALQKGLEALNKQLVGRVEIRSITGNLFTGFSLHDVRVIAGDSTFLACPLVDLRYQFRPILKEKTINAEVVIHNPTVRMIRDAKDSLWNFAKIARPSTDTTHKPLPFTINITGLEIIDATISMHDYTRPAAADSAGSVMDFARIDLANVNLSAQAHVGEEQKWLAIQHLGFFLPRAAIRFVDLSGEVYADSGTVRTNALRIETERTLLTLDARLDSVNFFGRTVKGVEGWKRAPVHLNLNAERISTLELHRFLPALGFLGGTPRIQLQAEGTFGDIDIKALQVGLTNSQIAIAGRIKNLNHPDSIYIEAKVTNSRLNYSDAREFVPGLNIPDLAYLGEVTVEQAEFVGYPKSFDASVDVSTDIGAARGAIRLDMRDRLPHYGVDIALAHVNAAKTLNNEAYSSDFTGHIVASGTGFTLPTLNTSFRLNSESSTIAGRPYRSLIAAGNVRNNGIVQLDTLLAAWGPKAEVNREEALGHGAKSVLAFREENLQRILGTRVQLTPTEQVLFSGAAPTLAARGTLDMHDRNLPRYEGALRGHRFAMSDIVPSASTTRMTFTLTANGSSFDPDQMNGTADLDLQDAELPDGRRVQPFTAHLSLDRKSPAERLLELRSDLADLDLDGEWNFKMVINGVVRGLSSITDYLGRKTKYREEDPFETMDTPAGEPVQATYSLNIKNLAPLEIFLNGARLAAEGDLHGDLSGTSQLFSVTAAGTVHRLLYDSRPTVPGPNSRRTLDFDPTLAVHSGMPPADTVRTAETRLAAGKEGTDSVIRTTTVRVESYETAIPLDDGRMIRGWRSDLDSTVVTRPLGAPSRNNPPRTESVSHSGYWLEDRDFARYEPHIQRDAKQASGGRGSMVVRLTEAVLQIDLRNIAPGKIDDITSIDASIRTDSTAQFNSIIFNAPRLHTTLEQGALKLNGATGINGTISLAVNGEVNTNDAAGYRITLDTIRIGMPNKIRWRNVGAVRALVSDDAITIDSLALRRNRAELVEVHGSFVGGETFRDVSIHASETSLQDLGAFFASPESQNMMSKLGGWLRDFRLNLSGTLLNPSFNGSVAVDSIGYAGSQVGNLLATFNYADRNMSGNVRLGPARFAVGTPAEARAEIAELRGDMNDAIATLNTMLPAKQHLNPLPDSGNSQAQLELLNQLSQQVARLGDLRSNDTTQRFRGNERKREVETDIRQMSAVIRAEMSRGTVDSANLSAQISLISFPIDLAFAARDQRILEGRPVDIRARTDSLPIGFLAPFFSGIQVRSGVANMRFNVTGSFPKLVYSGEGDVHNAHMLVEGNNMNYYADARIRFSNQTLSIEELTVQNDPRDLPGGRATVTGAIKFDGFKLKDLNLLARTDQLMVLSDAAQAVNETVYGPLVIASGSQPLRFTGTLDSPRLTGDIDVLRGQLRMERGQTAAQEDQTNPATYVDLNEWRRRTDSENVYGPETPENIDRNKQSDTSHLSDAATVPGSLDENFERLQERIGRVKATLSGVDKSFADLLQLGLNVRIKGRLFLTIDFSPFEQLLAVLATDQEGISIRRGVDGKLDMRGAVHVLNGSKYNFIKLFDASGDLTFAGELGRTKLGIVAEHNGRRLTPSGTGLQDYQVIVNIGGTMEKPDIKLDYTVDGMAGQSPDQEERNRNAISLLLFGRTADEVVHSAENASLVSDFSNSVIGSGTSSIASRLLTDILAGGTDFIRSIDVDLSGRAANARLNIVSQFGDVIVRAGGQISDPINNGSLVAEVPFASLVDIDWLRNVALRLEALRQTSDIGSISNNDPSQAIRLGFQYRKQW